jgi:hypothetical protein
LRPPFCAPEARRSASSNSPKQLTPTKTLTIFLCFGNLCAYAKIVFMN